MLNYRIILSELKKKDEIPQEIVEHTP